MGMSRLEVNVRRLLSQCEQLAKEDKKDWRLDKASPAEKVVAAQLLSHGTATSAENITKEIHQKTTSKYSKELREQLFQNEKGSDSDLRQRKQKTSGEDLDALLKFHHTMQEKIADDMLTLARSLKEQSQLAGTIIRKDTETIDKSSVMADKNLERLKVESERLEEHSRRAWKCWMWLMILVVLVVFINMVFFMRFKKKKKV
ncbi:vesicle transport protein USE1 isoform X2 [Anabrus simplex]|uniref:vesicle transport protein USE1 isoform X2 n=1 Tax=Anabrus simplex TaxID=316456 RepID=UPI0034DDA721